MIIEKKDVIEFYNPLFSEVEELYGVPISSFSKFYYYNDESPSEEETLIVETISDLIENVKNNEFPGGLVRKFESESCWFTYILYDSEEKFVSYEVDKETYIGGVLIVTR